MLEGAVRHSAVGALICASDAPKNAIFEDLEAFKNCVALSAKILGTRKP